jgi:DNA-binding GntR family transcriptional regulator
MARGASRVVQVERLRDQIYQLIRDDLKSGVFAPGQRLVEVELAEKYGVSRTPVREALFQLTRGGFLDSTERGYSAPSYSKKDVSERLEVKRLLMERVVEHAAREASALQTKRMVKLHEQEKAAHAGGNVDKFNEANHAFRVEVAGACQNQLLGRQWLMIEDQFEVGRGRLHRVDDNRRLTHEHDSRLLAAIEAHDEKAAVAEVASFIDFLVEYYDEHAAG